MSKRGPKRETVDVSRVGKAWFLLLECRHRVERRVKSRTNGSCACPTCVRDGTNREIDPAPTWVYCEKCAEAGGEG